MDRVISQFRSHLSNMTVYDIKTILIKFRFVAVLHIMTMRVCVSLHSTVPPVFLPRSALLFNHINKHM